MNVAGIDVSHKTVTLVIDRDGRTRKPREFKNTPHGHQTLVNRLRTAQVNHVCLEATGLYHLDLALVLDDAGLEVMVVHPKAAKRFAEAIQTRTKTDAVDAAVLANSPAACPSIPGNAPTTWPWPSMLGPPHRRSEQAPYPNQKPAPCRPTDRHNTRLPDR